MHEPAPQTGVPAVDTLAVWCTAIAAIVGGAGLLWRGTRSLRRLGRRAEEFIDDWHGVPGRAGVEPRPGVMERLDAIENRLGTIEHELHPNSGVSLRDAVDRVDQRTARIAPDPH